MSDIVSRTMTIEYLCPDEAADKLGFVHGEIELALRNNGMEPIDYSDGPTIDNREDVLTNLATEALLTASEAEQLKVDLGLAILERDAALDQVQALVTEAADLRSEALALGRDYDALLRRIEALEEERD